MIQNQIGKYPCHDLTSFDFTSMLVWLKFRSLRFNECLCPERVDALVNTLCLPIPNRMCVMS